MGYGILLAAALAVGAPDGAVPSAPPTADPPRALPAPQPAPASAPTSSADGAVTSYPPGFFTPSQPSTALDMVNLLPGFTLDLGDTVRGFGGAAGNVLIDGARPASKTDTLDEVLKRIPVRSVLRIDVIRGGAPGIDMQGKTVIANVIQKADDGLKLTTVVAPVVLPNGALDYGFRLEGAKRSGPTSFEGSLLITRNPDDGTGAGHRVVTNGAGQVTQTAYERSLGQQVLDKAVGAVETPVAGGKLRLEGSLTYNPYLYRDDDTLIDPPGREFERYTQDQGTGEVGLRYERPLGGRASAELYVLQQLGYYSFKDAFTAAAGQSRFTLSKPTGESIVRGVVKFNASPTLALEAGAEGDYNWLKSRTLLTDDGQPVPIPAANVRVTELRGEAFADATWRPLSTLTLEGGVRVEASKIASSGDVISTASFVFPKPRAVASWSPDAADQFRLRVEREVGQLDFADFTASGSLGAGAHAGNPKLTPQQDWVVEAAYERRFWGGGDVSLTARRYWYANVIDRAPTCDPASLVPGNPPHCDPAAEFDAPANIGDGANDELALSLTLPTDKLLLPRGLLTVRSTWRMSRVTDPSTHRPRGLSGLHPVDAEAHYTQGLPGLKSIWGFDVFPSWTQTYYRFNEIDTDRLGFWLDVFVEYKPRPDFTLRVEADNLTDHGFDHIRRFYDPFRDQAGAAISSVDERHPRFGPYLTLKARKTFG